LGLSAKVAKDNPALALSLAHRVLRYPLNNNWYFALYQIAANNAALATRFTAKHSIIIQTPKFSPFISSAYPFGRERIFGIESSTLGSSVPPIFPRIQI
jgi:hypothetical protein